MRKLNRKLLFLLLTAFLMANVTVVYAYTMHHTQELVNTFLPAHVDAEVVESYVTKTEKVTDENGVEKVVTKYVKESLAAENTSNIEAYLRLRVIAHWEDTKGNIVAKSCPAPELSIDTQNWIKYSDTDTGTAPNINIYYYKLPVAPGDTTGNLLTKDLVLNNERITYKEDQNGVKYEVQYEYNQVITIIAEAIQSKPINAVEKSWGVKITQDATDGIYKISEIPTKIN